MRRPIAAVVAGAVALAGAGTVATFALAQGDPPPTATFDTTDSPSFANVAGGGSTATIALGGKVTIRNGPGGAGTSEEHDVNFNQAGNPAGGVNCVQTAGGVSSGQQIPPAESDAAWAGDCTFTQPGTYAFICNPHALEGMRGTVTVVAPGTPQGPGGPAAPGTQGGGTQPPPAQPPVQQGTPPTIKVASSQKGDGVHGTITGAKRQGRAKIEIFALRGDLGLTGSRTAETPAGSLSASVTKSGGLDFVVPVSAKGRSAVAKNGRLALSVRVTAPRVQGTATAKTFKVTLRKQTRPPPTASVTLRDNLFSPSSVALRKGGTVTWRWRDGSVPHDVRGNGFRSEIQRSGTYKRTFGRTGTYTYICTLHDGMKGKVVVR
jgi:plastocyanin